MTSRDTIRVLSFRGFVLTFGMVIGLGLSAAFRPSKTIADEKPKIDLETMVGAAIVCRFTSPSPLAVCLRCAVNA